MSRTNLCCLLIYFAITPSHVIFTKALNSKINPDSVSILSSTAVDDNRPPVIKGFIITDEFLEFYELFVTRDLPQLLNEYLDCTAYSSSKGNRSKILLSNINKETLDMFEIYKTNKRNCVCATSLCLRKCCEKGQAIDLSTYECQTFNTSDEISFEAYEDKTKLIHKYNLTTFHTLFYGMKCNDIAHSQIANTSVVQHVDTFKLIDFDNIDERGVVYDSNSFCLENFVEDDVLKFQGALVCILRGDSENLTNTKIEWALESSIVDINHAILPVNIATLRSELYLLQLVCMGCTISFLVITFLVYVTIPELRDDQGKYFMCYTVSLMTTDVVHVVLPWITGNPDHAVCQILGFIAKISYFAVYFWLNVICIGVWRTFCSFHVKEQRRRKTSKFLISSCYAWGGSVIISLIIQYSSVLFGNVIAEFKSRHCFVDYLKPIFGLFIMVAVVGILLILNLVLYVCATIKIFIDKRKLKVLANKRNQWSLYFKLFVITGMFWVFKVIIDWVLMTRDITMWAMSLILLQQPLQAICIFWIFVFSQKARPLIKRKLGDWYQRMLRTNTRSNVLSDGPCRNTSKSNETQESELASIDRIRPVDVVYEID